MIDLDSLAPTFVTVGLLLGLGGLTGHLAKPGRALAAILCIFLGLRFLWWHATEGMPAGQDWPRQAWAWTFFFFEAMSILCALSVYVFMARSKDRSGDADRHANSPLHRAPVDVFIVTYNEAAEILERTIVGAMGIDHPDLRVWVLDDGAREWVRDLAAELGAFYVQRIKGKHAKAGNVNNGLAHALGTGRRPDFILLLDADFIPSRMILKRTLGLFDDPSVGIVQTPQHFFNPDPIQSNLLCSKVWPDEQRFFYDALMPCKDAWGVAFCCGTSAVLRVAALEATEGFATETVTEDLLTSLKMEEIGYRTIYLNEPLSIGLAPEGLRDYVSQRCRWCLGTIQTLRTRWSFFGPARLRLVSRFSCLDGTLYWLFSFPFKFVMILAPMVYWWTGASVIVMDGLLEWFAPHAVAGVLFMGLYSRNRIMPIMTDVTQLLVAIPIARTAVVALIKPWGHPFKVTAKGTSTGTITIQWGYLMPFVLILAGTLLGMLINLSRYGDLSGTPGYVVNMFWSIYNITLLALAVGVCIELPRRRRDERFTVDERAMIRWSDGQETVCRLNDISLGGAHVEGLDVDRLECATNGVLLLDSGTIEVPFEPLRRIGGVGLGLRFALDTHTRRGLIRKIFAGAPRNTIERVNIPHVALAVGRKLLT